MQEMKMNSIQTFKREKLVIGLEDLKDGELLITFNCLKNISQIFQT